MNALVEQNRNEFERIRRGHKVARIELFGSAARDDFNLANRDADLPGRSPRSPQ